MNLLDIFFFVDDDSVSLQPNAVGQNNGQQFNTHFGFVLTGIFPYKLVFVYQEMPCSN